MPITKSAIKKVRVDKTRRQRNLFWKKKIKKLAKEFKTALKKDSQKADEIFISLQKVIDKAAKKKVVHKNKAARLKSNFAKLLFSGHAPKVNKPSAQEPS